MADLQIIKKIIYSACPSGYRYGLITRVRPQVNAYLKLCMERSSSDIDITWDMYFFRQLSKLESNSGRAKCLAVVEYFILICISLIVRGDTWAVSLCDCRSGLYCGREADRRK